MARKLFRAFCTNVCDWIKILQFQTLQEKCVLLADNWRMQSTVICGGLAADNKYNAR